jgi:ABC-type Fe3+-siderophore transport system permease subunit
MIKTVLHLQPMSRQSARPQLARPLAVAALLVILALSVGGALAQRMEQRASEDRLVIGDVTEQG